MLTCLCGMFASTFTITILGVSLASIADDLGSDVGSVAWVMTAPMLAQALSLPLLGKVGDIYGHRRVYLIGFGFAIAGALLTAISWNVSSLIAFRTVGQLAGTATMPASTALLFTEYAPEDRVRAMGWVSLVTAGSPVLGLAVGGVLVDTLGWRPIFFIQAALSIVALAAAAAVLGETAKQKGQRLDWAGALPLTATALALTFGVNRLPVWGITHPLVAFSLCFVPVGLLWFVRAERRAPHPLVPLEFFRRRNFAAPLTAGFFVNVAYMGGFIITPLLLQRVFGFTTAATSFLIMLRPIALALASPVSGFIATRVGERAMAIFGATLVSLGMLSFCAGSELESVIALAFGLVLAGVGLGTLHPSSAALVGNAVDERNFGVASSAIQMASSVGAVTGISVLTAFTSDAVETDVYTLSYAMGAASSVLGLIATLFIRRIRFLGRQ